MQRKSDKIKKLVTAALVCKWRIKKESGCVIISKIAVI